MPLFERRQPTAGEAPTRRANAPRTAAAAPAQTALLKRYRPLETRAQGGFGSVEVCLDTRLMRRVAIKRIPLSSPLTRTSEATIAEALAEARTASMLSHPNIVSVIDFTYDATYAYLVMEYVDGMSLAEFLSGVDGHSVTYDEAAALADALSQALSYAHENGVLHLDIKPANVLIDHKGHIRLADFGMATLASAAGFGGARGGTVGYMPPEQLEGEVVDERSDVFSLATVLYESLCATSPFAGGTPQDSLKRIEKGPLYPSDLLPNIPMAAEDALLQALDPDPSQRMASIADFAEEFLDGLGDPVRGRKSLGNLVATLTSDEKDEEAPGAAAAPIWEYDPSRGRLASRYAWAPRAALGVLTGAFSFVLAYGLLGSMGLSDPLPRAMSSAVIAAASGVAPQVGSALALAGVLVVVLGAAGLSLTFLTASLLFVLGGTWWFVWGRTAAASSAVVLGFAAIGQVAGTPLLCGGLVAALGAYLLDPPRAAPSVAFGILFALLLGTLADQHFVMNASQLARLLGSWHLWAHVATLAAGSSAASLLLRKGTDADRERGGTALVAAGIVLPGIVAAVGYALAYPMEIGMGHGAGIAAGLGLGIASSIIVWISILLFGHPERTPGR